MKKFITRERDNFITHDVITNCVCGQHLLRLCQYDNEDQVSIMHYSCAPEEAQDSENLCWDVILDKKQALELASAIFFVFMGKQGIPSGTKECNIQHEHQIS